MPHGHCIGPFDGNQSSQLLKDRFPARGLRSSDLSTLLKGGRLLERQTHFQDENNLRVTNGVSSR
jgi:hypothetical protein